MKSDPLRRQIVVEASRLVSKEVDTDYRRAIRTAARRICGGRLPRARLPELRELHAEMLRLDFAREVGEELSATRIDPLWSPMTADDPDTIELDRYCIYKALLLPLASVQLPRRDHPEGDALYHSLQVFTLARDRYPHDEEVQLAALLHEVGRAIDPGDAMFAALEALGDSITERPAWFIESLPAAHEFRTQKLGLRARRRLLAHPDFDHLQILAECDRDGRCVGAITPDVHDALQQINDLSQQYESSE